LVELLKVGIIVFHYRRIKRTVRQSLARKPQWRWSVFHRLSLRPFSQSFPRYRLRSSLQWAGQQCPIYVCYL